MILKTYTGKEIDIFNLNLEDISLIDIAHALSNICRFAGHTTSFYSVAEHSVRVARICSEKNKLYALLHNASEIYLHDIPRPIKELPEFKFYRLMENEIQMKIFTAFGLETKIPEDVKICDNLLLEIEMASFLDATLDTSLNKVSPEKLLTRGWLPSEAKGKFLQQFAECMNNKKQIELFS